MDTSSAPVSIETLVRQNSYGLTRGCMLWHHGKHPLIAGKCQCLVTQFCKQLTKQIPSPWIAGLPVGNLPEFPLGSGVVANLPVPLSRQNICCRAVPQQMFLLDERARLIRALRGNTLEQSP